MALEKISRLLGAFILLAFIAVSLFGSGSGISMQTEAHGKMTGCIFSGTTLCTMTPFEHMAEWQTTLSSIPTQAGSALLLLLVLAAVYVAFVIARQLRHVSFNLIEIRQKLYRKRAFTFAYADPLQEAFSQGILNPKTY